jgi:ER-bound oxygenase mpaB/B'/Rubber oxygenase, catalytic domain
MPTDDFLLGLRADGDHEAGKDLHEAVRRSPRTAADVLRVLRKPAADQPQWLHALLDEWVQAGPSLPSWADPDLIEAGQQLFDDWDLAICTALFAACLPSAYAGRRGVPVLARVSQLAEPGTVARRIAETGQMLLEITKRGALERGGDGYKRIVLVRVLHEAVREVLLGKDPPGGDWPAANGVPVNQEDLLATLMTFTVIVFRALDRMGIKATPADQKAYLHLWAVVGDLLGITQAKLLCQPRDADRLTTRFQQSLQGPSDDGAYLMSVLLREMELAMPLGWLRVPRTVVRFLIGDQVANMIKVPGPAWWSPALPAAAALNRLLHRYPQTRHLSELPSQMVGRRIIQLWIDQHQRGERHPFSITNEQAQRWRLADDDRAVTAIRRQLRSRRQRLREAHLRVPRRVSPADPSMRP